LKSLINNNDSLVTANHLYRNFYKLIRNLILPQMSKPVQQSIANIKDALTALNRDRKSYKAEFNVALESLKSVLTSALAVKEEEDSEGNLIMRVSEGM